MRITEELREWFKDRIFMGNGYAELNAIADAIEAELAERYIALPVDAECEPIHVGDVMEWCDPDGEVTVTCEVDAVGVECFFAWDEANGRYAQKCANAYRHHHTPTVESVLWDMYDKLCKAQGARYTSDCTVVIDSHEIMRIIAEYAAKLRLREG